MLKSEKTREPLFMQSKYDKNIFEFGIRNRIYRCDCGDLFQQNHVPICALSVRPYYAVTTKAIMLYSKYYCPIKLAIAYE